MTCEACKRTSSSGSDITMAFQPIYDAAESRVWGYEALVRGRSGQGAAEVLSQVTPEQLYSFDQQCRTTAIELAARLFPRDSDVRLSINFMPNAVYEPAACLRATLSAADRHDFPRSSIMFEFTENEQVHDTDHLKRIIAEYRKHGFTTAIDDFGAGHAGLGLLVEFQPDVLKLDMHLLHGVDADSARRSVVSGVVGIARELDVTVLAEGVESERELATLHAMGIDLFQGFWFARPQIEAIPSIDLAAARRVLDAGLH